MDLPASIYEEMLAHAKSEAPNEACGVVAGKDGVPVRVYPMRNIEASPTRYRFDSREQNTVKKEIEDNGWDTLAFFHSHTHTEAYPSKTDKGYALWRDQATGEVEPAHPGTRYIILSLSDDARPVRAFRIESEDPIEEEVRIV